MNKRIRELIQSQNSNRGLLWTEEDKEEFANLIVRECCNWIDGSPSTDAGQLLLTKSFIIANIKGHFGVER